MHFDKTEENHNYFLMTLILFWAGLVVMSSLYVTIPLIEVFSRDFAIAQEQAVWASSAFSFCFAGGCLLYGPLSEKYGRKKVIFLGLVALSAITFSLGFVRSFPFVILLRAMQGAAAATFSPVALSYAQELFPQHKKVGAVGWISTGFLMAGIIGQVFSSFVQTNLGWNWVFLLSSAVYILTAVLIWFFIPTRPANGANITVTLKQIPKTIQNKQLLSAYIVASILLLSFVGMYTALGSYLTHQFSLNGRQIFYVRLLGILGMTLSPLAGNLVKRFSIVRVLRFALILALIGLVLLSFGINAGVMIISSIVFVSGIAIAIPSLISLIGILGGQLKGVAISIYTFILFLGASIGPILTTNLLKTGNYVITFGAVAGCVAIGILATFFIKPVE